MKLLYSLSLKAQQYSYLSPLPSDTPKCYEIVMFVLDWLNGFMKALTTDIAIYPSSQSNTNKIALAGALGLLLRGDTLRLVS